MIINYYATRFVQLSQIAHIMVATKSQNTQKFLKGLKEYIFFYRIAILKLNTYVEVLKHGQLVEELISTQHQPTHILAQQ